MTSPAVERELISRYVDEAVTEQERALAERLLRESAELRAYADELRGLGRVLEAWTPETPSPNWEAKMRAAIRTPAPVFVPGRRKSWALGWQLGAVCSVTALLVLAVTAVIERQAGEEPLKLAKTWPSQPTATAVPSATRALEQRVHLDASRKANESVVSSTSYACSGSVPCGPEASLGMSQSSALRREIFVSPQAQEQWRDNGDFNTERYDRIYENRFLAVAENALSTFSIDVDTASYANIRRFLQAGQLPPEDAVRIEEMLNYFTYEYPQPEGTAPFSITVDRAACPWKPGHELVRIGLQGKVLQGPPPPSNLVFLIDVSGSMNDPAKLPLLQTAFRKMVGRLTSSERVAMVVYAGAAGLVLESTPGDQKSRILAAIDQLQAGGSTAGGAGIQLAYQVAREHFIEGGNNRVVLATDGDFNVGVSSQGEMVRLIEEERKSGIFLTILGFGTGNYNDAMMEQVAGKGNGNYYYIDTEREADKVLGEELGSTLFTIAKDVKIQIEFNPAHVKAYRLVGYENRMLAKEDFNDDTKDAGELGAGHTVTALYELVPAGSSETFSAVDNLAFQQTNVVPSDNLMVVKLRYKEPAGDTSQLLTQTLSAKGGLSPVEGDVQFAAAVAEFGMLLRTSEFKGEASYDHVLTAATESLGTDPYGYRQEFVELVKAARRLDTRDHTGTPGLLFKGQGATPDKAGNPSDSAGTSR